MWSGTTIDSYIELICPPVATLERSVSGKNRPTVNTDLAPPALMPPGYNPSPSTAHSSMGRVPPTKRTTLEQPG